MLDRNVIALGINEKSAVELYYPAHLMIFILCPLVCALGVCT